MRRGDIAVLSFGAVLIKTMFVWIEDSSQRFGFSDTIAGMRTEHTPPLQGSQETRENVGFL